MPKTTNRHGIDLNSCTKYSSKSHAWSTQDKLWIRHVFGMLWPMVKIADNIIFQFKVSTAAVIKVNNFVFIKWLLNNSLFSQQVKALLDEKTIHLCFIKRTLN